MGAGVVPARVEGVVEFEKHGFETMRGPCAASPAARIRPGFFPHLCRVTTEACADGEGIGGVSAARRLEASRESRLHAARKAHLPAVVSARVSRVSRGHAGRSRWIRTPRVRPDPSKARSLLCGHDHVIERHAPVGDAGVGRESETELDVALADVAAEGEGHLCCP